MGSKSNVTLCVRTGVTTRRLYSPLGCVLIGLLVKLCRGRDQRYTNRLPISPFGQAQSTRYPARGRLLHRCVYVVAVGFSRVEPSARRFVLFNEWHWEFHGGPFMIPSVVAFL